MKVISYVLIIYYVLSFALFGVVSDEIFPPQESGYLEDHITITTPGRYTLERGVHHSYPVGVVILSSSVILSGNDHLISPSSSDSGSVGIWIAAYDSEGIPITDVTLSNLRIEGETYGIFIEGDNLTPFSWANNTEKPTESPRQTLLTQMIDIFSSTISSCVTAIGISDGIGVRITDVELYENEYGITASGRDLEIQNTTITAHSKAGVLLDGVIRTSLSENTITGNNIGIKAIHNSINTLNESDNTYENSQNIVTDEEDTPFVFDVPVTSTPDEEPAHPVEPVSLQLPFWPSLPETATTKNPIDPLNESDTSSETSQNIVTDGDDTSSVSDVPVTFTLSQALSTPDEEPARPVEPFLLQPSFWPSLSETTTTENPLNTLNESDTSSETSQNIVTDEEDTPSVSDVPVTFTLSQPLFPPDEETTHPVEPVLLQTPFWASLFETTITKNPINTFNESDASYETNQNIAVGEKSLLSLSDLPVTAPPDEEPAHPVEPVLLQTPFWASLSETPITKNPLNTLNESDTSSETSQNIAAGEENSLSLSDLPVTSTPDEEPARPVESASLQTPFWASLSEIPITEMPIDTLNESDTSSETSQRIAADEKSPLSLSALPVTSTPDEKAASLQLPASASLSETPATETRLTTSSPVSSAISAVVSSPTVPPVMTSAREQYSKNFLSGTHATIISDTIPDVLAPASRNQVSITIANTGSTVWQPDEGIGISSVGDTAHYAPEWIPLSTKENGRNREYIIPFTLVAPATPGAWTFSFRVEKRRAEMTSTFGRPYTKTVLIS